MSWRFKIDPFQLFNDWKWFRPLEWRKVFSHPKEWMFPCWTLELLLFFSSFVRETFRYFSDKLKLSTEGLIQVEPVQFSSVQSLSRSHSLCPHESQHARPPCSSSPTPRVHSNSRPLSRWCHPAISSSCCPLLLLPPIPPSIRVFSDESTLHMRWPKYWSFSFSIIPAKEHPGLISFRMDWLDLLAV